MAMAMAMPRPACNYITSLCKQGRLKEALHILYNITDLHLDCCTYIFLLQSCIRKKTLGSAKLIHAHICTKGLIVNRAVTNTLGNMYAKCGCLADARKLFDHVPRKDVCSWTVMISAYAKHGFPEMALELFREMLDTDVLPNHFTFATVLPACASLASLEDGIEIHNDVKRRGFDADVFVANALVDMYAKCGSLENARYMFDKITEPDTVSWTALIAGYAQKGYIDEALQLFGKISRRDVWSWTVMIAAYARIGFSEEALVFFGQMLLAGLKPNQFTFAAVLPACSLLSSLEEGVAIHGEVIRSGLQCNVLVTNALIDMYAKCGRIEIARDLFDKMSEPDLISWTTILAGYSHNGLAEDTMELFKQMQFTGVKPDEKTFASILPACAGLGALQQGMQIHDQIVESGFQSDVFLVSALIDMYGKCGSLEKARKLFDKMRPQDVVSWTAMIAGYAIHGRGKEALKIFEQMKHSGINPNHVTLICVLSACCHAGLVEEGRLYFSGMYENHHITPSMRHYNCMVDLLGRAGLLDEALAIVNKMPIKADVSVWNSLIGGCRLYNNAELGQLAAKKIIELEPQSTTPYVLLSKIYAASGRWSDIEKLRKMMEDKEVMKTAGCSWIEVNRRVHPFLSGDI
ncbi:pentatricopeptide repeat-containing protein At1g08070, chloroplastic [Cryptomeria japonica]|uniref:pentatricopeptide repeat-containing protein At1g08070, chloroplastic n=1 Tax=Cryptomeria japonica TaxID=3369 RepID=UPI0027DA2837|nr:pentatricopeptide repeat-containing protein At1g08070, chloroplastic [Cryptomeria japonica]